MHRGYRATNYIDEVESINTDPQLRPTPSRRPTRRPVSTGSLGRSTERSYNTKDLPRIRPTGSPSRTPSGTNRRTGSLPSTAQPNRPGPHVRVSNRQMGTYANVPKVDPNETVLDGVSRSTKDPEKTLRFAESESDRNFVPEPRPKRRQTRPERLPIAHDSSLIMSGLAMEEDYPESYTDRQPARTERRQPSRPSRPPHRIIQVDEPPPRATGLPSHLHPSVKTRLRNLRHNKIVLALVGLIALLLVIGPLLGSLIPSNQQAKGNGINSGINHLQTVPKSDKGETPVVKSADPHQLTIVPPAGDHPAPPVYAQAAFVMDADSGATVYSYNPFKHLPILSTTKLMTATLAVEKGGDPNRKIRIDDKITADMNKYLSPDSSVFGVHSGSTYTLREMMDGLLMVSGNDCAIVIADVVGGSVPNFVKMMNDRAKELGMVDTHYVNPHGLLDKDHYSSARDLAVIGQHALAIPLVQQISNTHQKTVADNNDHPGRLMNNGDQFIWWYPGVNGGKPGWDGEANFVQVISAIRDNRHLIGVVIHTKDWWTDMRSILNYGFNDYKWVSPKQRADSGALIPFATDDNYFADDLPTITIPTADGGKYYPNTGYAISGPIKKYFDKNNGLDKFGYPTSAPTSPEKDVSKQRFEHGSIQCELKNNQCKVI